MKKVWQAARIVLLSILSLVLVWNVYLIAARLIFQQTLPKIFGFSQATVISGSMEPAFSAGDMLIFRESAAYEVNDIVIFRCQQSFVTHRIIREEDGVFITQGDANNTEDEPLQPENIEGKMILVIPNAGRMFSFLKTPPGILILAVAAILLIELPSLLDRLKRKRVRE